MPKRRKVDLLPSEFRRELQDELKESGFSDYVGITERLNFRLEEAGLELRIGKSAVHAYGQEFQEYAEMQEQAQDEIRAFLEEASLKDEVDVTSALFQQLTTLQWRLQMALASPNSLPDPRGMKDLTTALNNLIRSSSLREKLLDDERKRVASEAREAERLEQAQKLSTATAEGRINADAAQAAREIMGFA